MLKGSKSVKGAANSNKRRQLKGKGSSKGSSSDSECDSTRVFYWTKDLKKHSSEIEGSGGGNSTLGYTIDELPIYYIGQKKAGFLTEANIVTGDDCSYTGVFSFEPNDNGRSMNQIFYQGAFAGFSLRIVHVNLMSLPSLTYVPSRNAQGRARLPPRTRSRAALANSFAPPGSPRFTEEQRRASSLRFRSAIAAKNSWKKECCET
jgi:hypothetical protein